MVMDQPVGNPQTRSVGFMGALCDLRMAVYATPLIVQAAYGIVFVSGFIFGIAPYVLWRFLAEEFGFVDVNGFFAVVLFVVIFLVVSVFGRLFIELCLTNYRILENLAQRAYEDS